MSEQYRANYVPFQLFGGAMQVTLPDSYFDVSSLRPVPDHQEVYVNKHDNTSLVFEILDYETSASDDDATDFFWQDMCETNDVVKENQRIVQSTRLDTSSLTSFCSAAQSSQRGSEVLRTASVFYVEGEQIIKKSKNSTEDTVVLDMLLIRLPNVTSDIVITSHTPISYKSLTGEVVNENKELMIQLKNALFTSIVSSFAINDWNLFG